MPHPTAPQQPTARSIVARVAIAISLLVSSLGITLAGSTANAVELPPSDQNGLFIQTSGPNAGLNIGDWYTTPVVDGGGGEDHLIEITIPEDWPGLAVTVALYDPELAEPDPSAPALLANDEIRNGADTATFTVTDPIGATIATETYGTSGGTNGAWVELVTFTPTSAGVWNLIASTSDDDDNSWRLSVGNDPDCPTGGCAPADLANGNEVDDPDGVPGTADELNVGIQRTSFQHAGSGTICNTFQFFVDGSASTIALNNFDMDNNGSVTYTQPDGSTVAGTLSGNAEWNGSTDSTRGGDVFAIDSTLIGWWSAEVCLNSGNQYIFEAIDGESIFLEEPPPIPELTLTKDDGVTSAGFGDDLTYTITFSNVSDLGTDPGQAHDVVITDRVPAGTTYVGCGFAIGTDGSCVESGGFVTWTIDDPVEPGSSGAVTLDVTVNADAQASVANTAQVSWRDSYSNRFAPVSATDTDTLTGADLSLTKTVDDATPEIGADIVYTVAVSNAGDLDAEGVEVTDRLPVGTTYVSHVASAGSYVSGTGVWTVGDLANGATETITITATVDAEGTITNVASVTASNQLDPDSTPGNSSTTEDDYDTATIVVGAGIACWLVADNGSPHTTNDLLTYYDGVETIIDEGVSNSDGTGTVNIEAIAFQPLTRVLYATNAGELGTIDTVTGEYSAIGATGYGDIDGLAFNPFTLTLYGAVRTGTDDLLIQIDTTTGVAIAGAFGGADSVAIDSTAAVGRSDVDDLAVSSIDGQLFGLANNGGADRLIQIDAATGAVTDVGPTSPASDVEGLTFDNLGNLLGTTGAGAELFDIDQASGTAGNPRTLTYADYEAADCDTNGSNSMTGTVFLDKNTNARLDPADSGTAGVTVELYRDTNGDGLVDGGDTLLSTTTSGAGGWYEFAVASTGRFVIAIDPTTLPASSTLTTDSVEAADFGTGFGLADDGNDFGYTRPTTLDVVKSSDAPVDLEPGDTITYTIDVTNSAGVSQTGFVVNDALPVGVTYVPESTSITYVGTTSTAAFTDDFQSGGFGGGSGVWATDFSEIGENDGPNAGAVQVLTDGDLALRLSNNDNGVERRLDLSAYTEATLTLDFRPEGLDDANDHVRVEALSDGGSIWDELGRIQGPADQATYASRQFDLSAHLTSTTRIRFVTSSSMGVNDRVYLDNVRIDARASGSITRTNAVGDPNPLQDGTPPRLVTPTDAVDVDSDQLLTVTFDAVVENPTPLVIVTNTAQVSSDQSPPVTDTISDPVTVSTIGDFVWDDTDGDGVQDAGETGAPDVIVNLLDQTEARVATTTTGPAGEYSFAGLAGGSYIVEFVAPSGESLTVQDQGGDDAADSDADPTTGRTAVFTVTSGVVVDNVDAGLVTPATIGDFVWDDLDADGVQDVGEPGLEAVRVDLLDIAGGVVDTAFTDGAGAYSFAVQPGTYSIRVTYPTDYIGSIAGAGTDIALDSDADPSTGRTPNVTVASGGTVDDLDVGANRPGSIGDVAWRDLNGNGIRDVGETGLPGVTVRLIDSVGTVLATDTTDVDGAYQFADVAVGEYRLEFISPGDYVLSRQDRGTDDSIDSDPDPDTGLTGLVAVTSGAAVTNVDAGLYEPLLVGDVVFLDLDADGIQEAGDRGVAGITVTLLTGAGAEVATTTTSDDGSYGFTDLAPGDYRIRVDVPGFVFVTADAGTDDTIDSDVDSSGLTEVFTLVSGTDDLTVDAGVTPTFIGDLVWGDLNGDGIKDAGEPGIPDVIVRLLDGDGNLLDDTTTDPSGIYQLPVGPGDHIIEFVAPAGSAFTDPNVGTDDAIDSDADPTTGRSGIVTIADDISDPTVDAGLVTPATLSGFVFLDDNGDGLADGEPGLDDVVVQLLDSAGDVVGTAMTIAGVYEFVDLAPGSYQVRVLAPTGTVFTQQDAGSDDTIDSDVIPATGTTAAIIVESGDEITDVDAGVYAPASIGDLVWVDLDSDGILDAGEPGLADVIVRLLTPGGTELDMTTTGANGEYSFTGRAPGSYVLEFTSDATFTTQDAGTDDTIDSDVSPTTGLTAVFAVTSGQTETNIDAGVLSPGIGDLVWDDLNGDGVRDLGEPGIPGVTVNLLNPAGTVVATVDTGANGDYLFTAAPGQYRVEFIAPTGRVFTAQDQGGNDAVDSDADVTTGRTALFTLSAGDTLATIDAGMYTPATIGDLVWDDLDGDGVRDAGEPGLANVAVNLLDSFGNPIRNMLTGADGEYEFSVAPGTYAIEFVTPTDYVFSEADAGTDDTIDSDADPTTGRTISVTVESRDIVTSLDAGMYEPVAIGDFVWDDLNGNGLQDAGEPGLVNVGVTLRDDAGNQLATTTTATGGFYSFEDLDPGSYVVQFTAPIDYVFSNQNAGSDDGADSDPDPDTGRTSTITVVSGAPVPTADAGFYKPLLVGDFVWVDVDGDGVQDAGEPGLAGVTVELRDAGDVVVATNVTSIDGSYGFTDLAPGLYSIQVVKGTLVFTTADVLPDDTIDSDVDVDGKTAIFTLTSGNDDRSRDAGVLPVSIGDLVWDDLDGDGVLDGDESGLFGVTVNLLDAAGNELASTTTDGDGGYVFGGLSPGDYIIEVEVPTGSIVAPQDAGGDDAADSDVNPMSLRTDVITLTSNVNNTTTDIGLIELATIGDFVWVDLDGDGVQDAAEPGLVGVVVNLIDGAGDQIDTTTTDADGAYEFTGIKPGLHTVEFVAAGFTFVAPGAGVDQAVDSDPAELTGLTPAIAVKSGDTLDGVDAGVEPAIIGDRVFEDLDGDGIQDVAEPGIDGVVVRLLDSLGAVIGTTTTVDGDFAFSVAPGTYRLEFVTPGGFVVTTSDVGGDDSVDSDIDDGTGRTPMFTVLDGTDNLSLDAGYWAPSTIGDLVWVDADGDGIRDAAESGIGGVIVRLLSSSGTVLSSTVTNGVGAYSFAGLEPGTYRVRFVPPAGYELTRANVGVDDNVDSDPLPETGTTLDIVVESGNMISTVDAGVQQPVVIGDFVWVDLDGDGVQDAGEPGLEGVTVNLLDDGNNVIDTVTTDSNGAYLFGDVPGTYRIEVVAPSFTFVEADLGGDDLVDSDVDPTNGRTGLVTVVSGSTDRSLDAGVDPATIGNFVFEDANGNGVQDSGEDGIGGVTVRLLDNAGNVLDTDVTSLAGAYSFIVAPGDYRIEVVTPNGYTPTTADVGADDTLDSDVDLISGRTAVVTVADSDDHNDVDAGYYRTTSIGDFVWLDQNRDGIQDSGEPGLTGVSVILTDATGATVATTTTDADGAYAFPGVAPGRYTLDFAPTSALTPTSADAGGDDTADSDIDAAGSVTIDLVSGTPDASVDAGFLPPVIGDFVWNDVDGDGVWEAGETGLDDVTVNLLDSTGTTVLATTSTVAGGYYSFNPPPGPYIVEFVTPPGMIPTLANQGGDDAVDSDADRTTGRTGVVTVSDTAGDLSVDAGFVTPATVGDLVWTDSNGNGALDGGETGRGNIDVELVDAGGNVVATAMTDGSGAYSFDEALPGTYSVRFIAPTGSFFSPANIGSDDAVDSDANPTTGQSSTFTIAAGETLDSIDAGLYTLATIGDLVWQDLNGDGFRDLVEPGLADVTVRAYLDDGDGVFEPAGDDTIAGSAITSAGGAYDIGGLRPGNYWIDVDVTTVPADGVLTTANDPHLVTATSGLDHDDADFGFDRFGTAVELVYKDENGNGVYDVGVDTPLPGIDVVFTDADGTVQTVRTGLDGTATATVAPGTVQIDVDDSDLPAGFVLTGGTDPTDVIVAAGETTNDATGYEPQGAITETVFFDRNGDGFIDPGEVLSGVDVVFTVGGVDMIVTTGTDGVATLTGVLAGSSVTIDIDDDDLPVGVVRTVGTDPTTVIAVADTVVADSTGYESGSAITIEKTAVDPQVVTGGTATFTITVRNTGTTELTDVIVDDPGYPQCDVTYTTLPIGEARISNCSVTTVTADFTNAVDVTATDPLTATLTAGASVDVTVLVPSFTVAKTPDGETITLNDDIDFTVRIENTGDTELVDLVIDDPLATCAVTTIAVLAIDEIVDVICTSSTVAADFTNTVEVSAVDPIGTTRTVSASADVFVESPDIAITKTATDATVLENGTATFTILVENTGEVDLTGVTVDDPLAPSCNRTVGALAVGADVSYTCTLSPLTADLVNVATASGADSVGNIVEASDDAAVDMISPSIELTKGPDVTYARFGETVTFDFTVRNTGDAPLTAVTVDDPSTPGCNRVVATLAVGASESWTCTATASSDFVNTASVIADHPAGGTVDDTDSARVDVIGPAVSITKSPGTQDVIVNGTATFTIVVANTGDSALVNVVVDDPLSPACNRSIGNLAVTATVSYSCTLDPIPASFTNVATVTAEDLAGGAVSAQDEAEVTTVAGVIEIQKTPDLQSILAGETATFEISVTNGGTIALSGVTVDDPFARDCDRTIGDIAAGVTVSYTCTLASVPADFTNTAAVSAVDAVGNSYADDDTAVVDVVAPAIAVSKTPDNQTVVTSGSANFTIEVVNTGDVALTAVEVTDAEASACDRTIATLAVGETVRITCSRPGVIADFTNTVEVVADEPSGGTVAASDTADVAVAQPALEIQKTPDLQLVGQGGSVTFTLQVTNTGESALTGVTVTDVNVPACDRVIGDLAVGESSAPYSCVATGVMVDFVNSATAAGRDPLGNEWTDTDTAAVDVVDPVLRVEKTPDLQTLLAGETANFTIRITNDGDTDLDDVVVVDALADGCDATFATIAAGVTETVTCSVTNVTVDFVNVVEVSAANPLGGRVSETDDAVVDVVAPGVEIQKTADTPQVLVAGDATFTIRVTNAGDQVLSGLVVTDAATPDCNRPFFDLGVGLFVEYTCMASNVGADFTNIAAVAGRDALGNDVSDSDDAAVDAIAPSISISKTPDIQRVVTGGTARFTITVTNTGDVSLTDVTVTDVNTRTCDTSIGTLATGETTTITCAAVGVIDDFTNTATVSATDPLDNVLSASDDGDVSVLVPAIEIQKSPDLQLVTLGMDATFEITVTNSGETPLTSVIVTDLAVPACGRAVGDLAVGETQAYTCTATAPPADFTNTAAVAATDPLGQTWTDSDTAFVDVIAPALTVSKNPDIQSVPLGSDATFTVFVINSGDVPLTDVTISDPRASGCNATVAALSVGETRSVTCSVTVTEDFTNTAFATAMDPSGGVVDGGSDDAVVAVLEPAIRIDVTPNLQAVAVGGDATFTITVTNSGDVPLTGINVSDPLVGDCGRAIVDLAPGESVTYTCVAPDVLEEFTNTVSVTAADGNGNGVSATDSADTDVLPAVIVVSKVAGSPTVVLGGDITYTITVRNTGPADVVDVVVTDATLPECDRTFAALAAGGVETYSCTNDVISVSDGDPVVNSIAVAARDAAGDPVTATATESVDVLVPSLILLKTTPTPSVLTGDTAEFELTVTNDGETVLTAVSIADPQFPSCARSLGTLAIGQTVTWSCSTGVLEADVTNTATATASDPRGATLTRTSSASVIVGAAGVLRGFVFIDNDGDGRFEPADGDVALANVDVEIVGDDGSVRVIQTDDAGEYEIRLPVGGYIVDVDETDPDFPDDHGFETTELDGQRVTVTASSVTAAGRIGYAIAVNRPPALTSSTTVGIVVGDPIPPLAFVDGENDGVTVELIDGSIPTGTTLRTDGGFDGIPNQPGVFTFTVRVCDDAGACNNETITITVIGTSTPSPAPATLVATGAESDALARWALLVTMLGFVLLTAARRPRRLDFAEIRRVPPPR